MRPGKAKRGPIDWSAVRERLAEVQARSAADVSPERAKALMAERARRLAQVPVAEETGATHEALAFGLGAERYFIDAKCAREVVRFSDCTPVPGTPDFVVGVTNLRGEVVCVVDLRRFLGLPPRERSEAPRVIVLGGASPDLGILVDDVFEVSTLRAREILPAPESTAAGRDYVIGVTRDGAVVLGGEALLRDPKLFIGQGEARDST